METITIYHNPNCGTSRNVLALIQYLGFPTNIIHYLENPQSETELRDLLKQMGISARQLLRTKCTTLYRSTIIRSNVERRFFVTKNAGISNFN